MGEVSFSIPWVPSLNRYYRHVGPRVLISREGRKFRRMVVSRLGGLYQKQTGRLALLLQCYPPDNRRRDADNICKCCLDALQAAGLYEDDSQIKDLRIMMLDPMPPDGMVYVELKPLEKKGDDDVSASRLSERCSPGRIQASPGEG